LTPSRTGLLMLSSSFNAAKLPNLFQPVKQIRNKLSGFLSSTDTQRRDVSRESRIHPTLDSLMAYAPFRRLAALTGTTA